MRAESRGSSKHISHASQLNDAQHHRYHTSVNRLESIADLTRRALHHEWSQLEWGAALYCVPINAAALWFGLTLHNPKLAMVVVGAAVTAAFGTSQQLGRWRIMPMVAATVGFAISAWIGAVLGRKDFVSSIAVTAIWGFMLALLTDVGQGPWWVAMQCVIALCISGAYPSGVWPATQRLLLIVAGGSMQIALMLTIWKLRGESWRLTGMVEPVDWKMRTTLLGIRFPMGNLGIRYTLRVTLVLLAAATVNYYWRWPNGYWIPMTAAIVLKTDFRTTYSRGIARLIGTIVGASAVTLFTASIHPSPPILAILVLLTLMICFAVQRVNYGLFAVFITAYVVFLLALAAIPEPAVALRRTIATFIGGAIALGSFAILPPGNPLAQLSVEADERDRKLVPSLR